MSQNEQSEQIAGNIQTAIFTKEDNGFQAVKWFFTYHIKGGESFEQAFDHLEGLKEICDKFIWGEEYGKSGKTPHIQGAFILKSKMRATTLSSNFFTNGVSLFKLKNWDASLKYCCKECNRIHSNCKLPKPLKIIENLYPYQKKIVDMVREEPNDRDIIWIFGDYNIGKTALSKYLVFHKLAFGPLDGEKRHMLSVIAQNKNEECFILYLTADESKYQKNSFFDVIEKVKDGFFMTHFGTDNTEPCIMNSPHILVFANERPDFNKTQMDQDRFKVFRVSSEKQLLDCNINYGYSSEEESICGD